MTEHQHVIPPERAAAVAAVAEQMTGRKITAPAPCPTCGSLALSATQPGTWLCTAGHRFELGDLAAWDTAEAARQQLRDLAAQVAADDDEPGDGPIVLEMRGPRTEAEALAMAEQVRRTATLAAEGNPQVAAGDRAFYTEAQGAPIEPELNPGGLVVELRTDTGELVHRRLLDIDTDQAASGKDDAARARAWAIANVGRACFIRLYDGDDGRCLHEARMSVVDPSGPAVGLS